MDLSAQLRDQIREALEAPNDRRDRDFCDQIRDSSASAPRNIAEGFGAFMPRENARFVRIARRSLMETMNHLMDGRKQGYFDRARADKLLHLNRRALGATTSLLRYLDGLKGEPPTGWSKEASANEARPTGSESRVKQGSGAARRKRAPNAEPEP